MSPTLTETGALRGKSHHEVTKGDSPFSRGALHPSGQGLHQGLLQMTKQADWILGGKIHCLGSWRLLDVPINQYGYAQAVIQCSFQVAVPLEHLLQNRRQFSLCLESSPGLTHEVKSWSMQCKTSCVSTRGCWEPTKSCLMQTQMEGKNLTLTKAASRLQLERLVTAIQQDSKVKFDMCRHPDVLCANSCSAFPRLSYLVLIQCPVQGLYTAIAQ